VDDLHHEARENCERVEELLVEQRELLESVEHNQGDHARQMNTNLDAMAEVKSQNAQLLERAECALHELKRLHSPFTEDLQCMRTNLQQAHLKMSDTHDAHTKDMRKMRKEQVHRNPPPALF
jgi:hypothetical protein